MAVSPTPRYVRGALLQKPGIIGLASQRQRAIEMLRLLRPMSPLKIPVPRVINTSQSYRTHDALSRIRGRILLLHERMSLSQELPHIAWAEHGTDMQGLVTATSLQVRLRKRGGIESEVREVLGGGSSEFDWPVGG